MSTPASLYAHPLLPYDMKQPTDLAINPRPLSVRILCRALPIFGLMCPFPHRPGLSLKPSCLHQKQTISPARFTSHKPPLVHPAEDDGEIGIMAETWPSAVPNVLGPQAENHGSNISVSVRIPHCPVPIDIDYRNLRLTLLPLGYSSTLRVHHVLPYSPH